jgi:hypothetical protein
LNLSLDRLLNEMNINDLPKAIEHKAISILFADDTSILINLLKPTGYMIHQQFNIQQLYALPTLHLCVLYLSENKQQLLPHTT